VTGDPAVAQRARQQAASLLDAWATRRKQLENVGLTYRKQSDTAVPLLVSSPTRTDDLFSVGWSLREVEPEINLVINVPAPEIAESPAWAYGPPKDNGAKPAEAEPDDDDEDEAEDAAALLAGKDGLDELGLVAVPAGSLPEGEAAL
jgi:hypothetical protein